MFVFGLCLVRPFHVIFVFDATFIFCSSCPRNGLVKDTVFVAHVAADPRNDALPRLDQSAGQKTFMYMGGLSQESFSNSFSTTSTSFPKVRAP